MRIDFHGASKAAKKTDLRAPELDGEFYYKLGEGSDLSSLTFAGTIGLVKS